MVLQKEGSQGRTGHMIRLIIIWLAPRAGKMKPILCSDWLPERAKWAYLARSGFPALFRKSEIIWCNLLAI